MPTSTWDLALVELVYFIPNIAPLAYCLWKHSSIGFSGWAFLGVFILLQVIGSAMTMSAGEYGTPSSTAIIITSVGLSPLLLAISGVLKEWTKLAGMLRTKTRQQTALGANIIYHSAVIFSLAIYASGAAEASDADNRNSDDIRWKAGIVLLFLCWLLLAGVFGVLAQRMGVTTSKPLFWSLLVSIILVGLRVIFQMVATFNKDQGQYNPVTGPIALRVIFQFLPGALTLAALVIGGILSINLVNAAKAIKKTEIRTNSGGLEMGALVDNPQYPQQPFIPQGWPQPLYPPQEYPSPEYPPPQYPPPQHWQ